jgi:hypothetical protein
MSLSMVVGKNKYFIGKVFNNKWIKVDINIWKFSNVFPSINNFVLLISVNFWMTRDRLLKRLKIN